MKTTSKSIQTRYRQLTQQLADLSWIAKGNTFQRFLVRKVGGKDKKCGPYFILTRKQAGRTVTNALNQPQFQLFSQAITNHRGADKILKQMRKLTTKYIQLTTPNLPSRIRSKAP